MKSNTRKRRRLCNRPHCQRTAVWLYTTRQWELCNDCARELRIDLVELDLLAGLGADLSPAERRFLAEGTVRPYGGPQWALAERMRVRGLLSYNVHHHTYSATSAGRMVLSGERV